MREIIFRAWDKTYRRWVCQNLHIDGSGLLFWQLGYDCNMIDNKDNYEICQYTSLKDKNGKEIYEGDIVECVAMHDTNLEYWGIRPPRYEVKWDNHETGYCFGNPYLSLPLDLAENWVIIGNIYENPELLEVKP